MSRQLSAPALLSNDESFRSKVQAPTWELAAKAGTLVLCAAAVIYSIKSGSLFASYRHWSTSAAHHVFFWSALVWSVICYASLIWRVRLWMRYKPMASVADAELPSISVIIPAFNEGSLVRQSIGSVANSDYPNKKLQIIVIDDGSSDDTWQHIQAAVGRLSPDINVMTLRHQRNQGKRRALWNGFQHALGDAIVTVDSDTIVERDALRNAVTPLIREADIGAVAGCVEVLNPYDSMITRFLKTTFSLSFKFVRAYQNEFRGVFCTPGAISVYRASVVRKVADEWLSQTFLGQPCTIGEDRAMTNLILREGYVTAYQQNARVWSKMPTTYRGMAKMLLRWARSNIRETIALNRFMFTNFRPSGRYLTAFRVNMLLVLSTLIVPYLLIGNNWLLTFTNPTYAARHAGMVVIYGLTMAAIYARNERDSDWIWLLLYELFWVVGLAWIMPYAAFTLRNTAWMTRGNPVGHGGHGPANEPVPTAPALGMPGDLVPVLVPAVARSATVTQAA